MYGLISRSSFQFHWPSCLCLYKTVPGCFQYCSSVVEFEIRDCDASRSFFIVQDCFGYPGFFAFPYEVEYHSFEVCEELYTIVPITSEEKDIKPLHSLHLSNAALPLAQH